VTLDRYRPSLPRLLRPLIRTAIRTGLTPNRSSLLAFFSAAIGGLCFTRWLLLPALVAVALNAIFDALDGEIARDLGIDSPRGDVLDHVLDRYADIFLITGILVAGPVPWEVGLFGLTGVLMASYLGTQAQAVGVGRYYGGLIGRADRLVLMIIATGLDIAPLPRPVGLPYLGWLLLLFGILGHITAVQRFVFIWRQLVRD